MTHDLYFGLAGDFSLREILLRGLSGYSLTRDPGGNINTVSLFIKGDGMLLIRSEVTSTAADSWEEFGTLLFEQHVVESNFPPSVSLSSDWAQIKSVEILTAEFDDVRAESGIVIVNQMCKEIIIAAGAFPHSIALLAPDFDGPFEPEFGEQQLKRFALEK